MAEVERLRAENRNLARRLCEAEIDIQGCNPICGQHGQEAK